jgi:hypothetical protein
MARPLTDLAEMFVAVNKRVSDYMKIEVPTIPGFVGCDEHVRINSPDFNNVCLDLINEAVEVSGSYQQVLTDILQLPSGEAASKGFLNALGLVSASTFPDCRVVLGETYNFLRETEHKVLADIKNGFTTQSNHAHIDPDESWWTNKTAGRLVLAGPGRISDFFPQTVMVNANLAIDILKTLKAQDYENSGFGEYKNYIVRMHASFMRYADEKSQIEMNNILDGKHEQRSHELVLDDVLSKSSLPNSVSAESDNRITVEDCVKGVREMAVALAKPSTYDFDQFTTKLSDISSNADYMKTSFIADFSSVYSAKKKRQAKEQNHPDAVFRDLDADQIESYKHGLFLFQKQLESSQVDVKLLIASMVLNLSFEECLDIKARKDNHPLWAEMALASCAPPLKHIEKSRDHVSIFLTPLMKNATRTNFDEKLEILICDAALRHSTKHQEYSFPPFGIR